VYIYNIFLIHSSVMGYLSCFQQTWVCMWLYCILNYSPSDICPEMSLLFRMAVLGLVFWGTAILIPIAVVLMYIHTNSVEVFLFPTSSPALLFVFLMIATEWLVLNELTRTLFYLVFISEWTHLCRSLSWSERARDS
jgi:hypothetical protein